MRAPTPPSPPPWGGGIFLQLPKNVTWPEQDFENYLKETFSLTTAGYYTKLYAGLGLSFGLMFGVAILSNLERSLGISLGLIGGMVVGSIMGRNKEAEAKATGNIL